MTAHINGPLLRQRRIEAALSLQQAATILGVGTPTLNRIESGDTAAQRAISVGSLLRLAEELGSTPTDLFHTATSEVAAPTKASAIEPEILIGVLRESTTQVSIHDLAATFSTSNTSIRAAVERASSGSLGPGCG